MAGRVFAYCRVSTKDQTSENQIAEIRAAGFEIDGRRAITEVVSGSVATSQRKGFARLLDRLETGDVLVVTKIDRLGRNAVDVAQTIERLAGMSVRVHCLQLNGTDLTSTAGKMVLGVISAMAQFERDLLIERTQAGLQRAKLKGKILGRRAALTPDQRADVRKRLSAGASARSLSKEFNVSRMTIMRTKDKDN